jgi:acetolactate synthase regulatory subunit
MSIRVGFDVDGVVANFNKTFRDTARQVEGASGALAADAMKRVWDHISRTPQWWLQLDAYEPQQIERLYRVSRERRWEVYFMTTRPSSAGETTQFQTQWWLESHGFALPAVLTVPGSRGDAANALKLDIAVDDRLTNCVDIIAASRSKAILLQRNEDQTPRDQALARGIAVVSTLEAAIDAVEEFEAAKRTSSGRLSRLADWFKPSKDEQQRLPVDARTTLGGVQPPPRD